MKRIYLLLITIFCWGALWGQCPSGSVTFTSQSQIDNFPINYPNCTQIFGGITVSGFGLNNLDGLSQITSIGGDIRIFDNYNLSDITGLENIDYTDITGLRIENNPSLLICSIESICGYVNDGNFMTVNNNGGSCINQNVLSYNCTPGFCLSYFGVNFNQSKIDNFATDYPDCTTILGPVSIGYGVTDLSGLSQLKEIRGRDFLIKNTALTSLEGLENLECVKYGLIIANNPHLTDISAFQNLNYNATDFLEIYDNPNLSDCNITSVCDFLSDEKPATIYANKNDCDNPIQLLNSCNGNVPSCLSAGVTFSTQGQIDSFLINYPDCQYIDGDVVIKGNTPTSITDLTGLSSVEAVNGKLTIQDNAMLNYLDGLEQLKIVDNGLDINNNGLANLSALDITHINGELIIRNNDFIQNLSGLWSIISGTINDLQIYNNSSLESCDITPICEYIGFDPFFLVPTLPNPTLITNNASGCDEPEEISNPANGNFGCFPILPIELTTFQAQIQNKTTLLTWQTATETHNSGFEVQRSKDGTTWEKIGWQDGQGDTQTPHDYTYTDENLLSGTSYYRLKQIDFDGAFSYSDIVKIDYASTGISIYPNPVKNTLHIADLNDNTIQNITIFDQMGRQILLQNTSVNTLDVSALSSGVYIIQVVLDSGVFSDRFIVK